MLGIYSFSLSEDSRSDEIADRHAYLLGCFHDLRRFVLGVVGEQGFPDGRVQSAAGGRNILAHEKMLAKDI